MIQKLCFPVFFLVFLFIACSNSRHSDFLKTSSGLRYKFYSLGTGNAPEKFNYIRIKYQIQPDYKSDSKAPVIIGEKFFQFGIPGQNEGIEEAIGMLNEGDSADFIFSHNKIVDFFTVDSLQKYPGELVLNLKITDIFSAKEFRQHYPDLIYITGREEQHNLEKYLMDHNIKEDCFSEGVYFIPEKTGKGEEIKNGNTISMHFTGSFLTGEIFDDTYPGKTPFALVVGDSGQIIPGLETGIKKMKTGGKAKIIIPSHLAFGEKGSSTGIIPPNTTVIYEVEILRVN